MVNLQSLTTRHFIVSLILGQILLLSACAGASDWSYSDLPGNYAVYQINTSDVALVKVSEDDTCLADIIIESYVSEIAWTDNFILVQQTNPESSDHNVSFYVVDIDSDEVHGPLSELEFNDMIGQLKIEFDNSDWTSTSDLAP